MFNRMILHNFELSVAQVAYLDHGHEFYKICDSVLLHLIKKEMPINISGIAKSKQIALTSF